MALRWTEMGARVRVFTSMPNRPQGVIHPDYRGKLHVEEVWNGIEVERSWLYASPRHGFARTLLNNVTFMATGGLAAALRPGGIDVLIASSPPFFPHIAGRAAGVLRRLPLVLEVRDLWPDYLVGMGVLKGIPARALFAVERRLLKAAREVVVVTESFRARIIEKGVAPERVHVIPNGVETDRYYRSRDEAPPLPELRRREGEFLVSYLGNFGAGQNLGTVLDAFELLARQAPEVRLVMVGDGPDGEMLRARAATMPNVDVLPPIAKSDTRAFYNACDLCLVPLAPVGVFQDTIPSKIFEIMACEVPVVASLGGEGRAIMERSGGGLVRRPGDAADIADGVLAMRALTPAQRAGMGVRGRAFVSENYDRRVLADRYLEILRTAAGRAAHG